MPVTMPCTSCGQHVAVPDHDGVDFRCPHCGEIASVPLAEKVDDAALPSVFGTPLPNMLTATSPQPAPFNFTPAAEAFAPEGEQPLSVPRYPRADWAWARRGLSLLAAAIAIVLVGHAGSFVTAIIETILGRSGEQMPEFARYMRYLFGLLDLLGVLAALLGVAVTCAVPWKSRLRGRAIAAAVTLTLFPVGVLALYVSDRSNADPLVRSATGCVAAMGAVIGTVLYILFFRDLSIRLGDPRLGDAIYHFLIQLVTCSVGLPVLVFGAYAVGMVLIGRKFFLQQDGILLIVSGAAFIAVGLLHLRFIQLVLQLRSRLDQVVR